MFIQTKLEIKSRSFHIELSLKQANPAFNADIKPLLLPEHAEQYPIEEAYKILFCDFLPTLKKKAYFFIILLSIN